MYLKIKRFSSEDLIQKRNFADLGEVGDFYADRVETNDLDARFGRAKVFGVVVQGEKETKAVLNITFPQEIDVLSLPAGKLFQSGWEEWQIETL